MAILMFGEIVVTIARNYTYDDFMIDLGGNFGLRFGLTTGASAGCSCRGDNSRSLGMVAFFSANGDGAKRGQKFQVSNKQSGSAPSGSPVIANALARLPPQTERNSHFPQIP